VVVVVVVLPIVVVAALVVAALAAELEELEELEELLAPLPIVVVKALVVLTLLPAEELLVEVAKVVEVLEVEVTHVGSSRTTLTACRASQTVFNCPALIAAWTCCGVMLKPITWLLPMRTEATSGFCVTSVGTRFNKSLTVQVRPPRSGQSCVATTFAVIKLESRQMLALMLQTVAPVVVEVGGPPVVDEVPVKDEVDVAEVVEPPIGPTEELDEVDAPVDEDPTEDPDEEDAPLAVVPVALVDPAPEEDVKVLLPEPEVLLAPVLVVLVLVLELVLELALGVGACLRATGVPSQVSGATTATTVPSAPKQKPKLPSNSARPSTKPQ